MTLESKAGGSVVAILDALLEMELAVSRFYARLADWYPQDRPLWSELSAEEISHARVIREMKKIILDKGGNLASDRLRLPAVQTLIGWVEEQTARVESGSLARRNAFFIARDLERSLIESQFYAAFRSDDQEFIILVRRVSQETKRHFRLLDDSIRERFPAQE